MGNILTTNSSSRLLTPTVIDVEASGFDPLSYPIEVGFVTDCGKRFSRLIRPYPDWDHWCEDAESLHGISRETLMKYGKPGDEVAAELNRWLQGKTIYSDGWVLDKPWLLKLFDRARIPMGFWVSPLESILSQPVMNHWQEATDRVLAEFQCERHRASTDAQRIQKIYMQALELAHQQMAG